MTSHGYFSIVVYDLDGNHETIHCLSLHCGVARFFMVQIVDQSRFYMGFYEKCESLIIE